MDAEKQADMIIARLRDESPRPPYAVGVLFLFGVILATAVIFY